MILGSLMDQHSWPRNWPSW